MDDSLFGGFTWMIDVWWVYMDDCLFGGFTWMIVCLVGLHG